MWGRCPGQRVHPPMCPMGSKEAYDSRCLGAPLPVPFLEVHRRSSEGPEVKTTHRSQSPCSFVEPSTSQTHGPPETFARVMVNFTGQLAWAKGCPD